MPKVIAVILAGGTGSRLGLSYPKQFAKVAGRTVLEHTLEVFERHPRIDEIVVVAHPAHVEEVLGYSQSNGWTKVSRVVSGGEDRFGSTWSALEALSSSDPESKVLFHDAVRPFIQGSVLDAVINELDRYPAVDVVIPTADTIVQVDNDSSIAGIPPRVSLRRGQTPQGFRLGKIRSAYERANARAERAFTCDCGVFFAMLPNERIGTVEGSSTNLKITHGEDLFLADKLFQSRGDAAAVTGETDAHTLAGKVVVVLGASEGIGAAICERARAAGGVVHGFSRSLTNTDISDADSVGRALLAAKEQAGRIDHVVNTAALLMRRPLMSMTDVEIRQLVDVNVYGTLHVARAAYPHLLESKGSLLFFTSSSYTRGRAFHSVYSATKAAVVNLSQALAEEWMEQGIRVNCINPERTRTPMRVRNFGVEPDDSLLSAERVADVSVRALAARMTGHVIDVRRPGTVPPGWGFGADGRD